MTGELRLSPHAPKKHVPPREINQKKIQFSSYSYCDSLIYTVVVRLSHASIMNMNFMVI